MDPTEIPLRDIHLPESIGWWPLATGWWFVLGAVVLLVVAALSYWRWRKRRAVRRTALSELSAIELRYREHRDNHRLAQELSRLARRAALATDPTRIGAAETGAAWGERLDELSVTGSTDERIKTALIRAPYRPGEPIDGDALLQAFRLWLANLRPPQALSK